ncbi:MAG TPA: ornithine cyclodeaminase family protein [Polaromonas sp.]|uniref:ornithine cyclodeaminase family protein n=1 Tax=Polaromonas sp. TaxID=1869339 RepID=UPI002D38AAB0|nr:ornithine cyclodeaminase family protein [Polaromonas sp.]HYW55820.1 ornithine cyclodeaminase family protein [Polaromonas sp.]
MNFISDTQVRATLSNADVYAAMEQAFRSYGQDQAVNLPRARASVGGRTISTMGAVLLDGPLPVMGVKSYPTIEGKFNFMISLFCANTGAALAMVQGNALTEFRTAAVTLLASHHLANKEPECLAIFGSGAQARAHAAALVPAFPFKEVLVIDDFGNAGEFAASLSDAHGVPARVATSAEAVQRADFIVTATRAKTPLFDGRLVRPGTFVAAIGSSKPDTRELDDALLGRAACIAVEDTRQALAEAGEFVMATPDLRSALPVVPLGAFVNGTATYQRHAQDITIYKSVGIGLEDVALARMLHQRLSMA